MHGRSYWNGFVKRLRQHPTETASRGKESLVAILPCFGPLSHAVCKITLAPLIFGTLWALLLALDQVVSAIQPQVVVISVKQGLSCVRNSREGRTSVTSIHQFSGIFFSEAFFSGVASPCLKQSNNRVIIECQPFLMLNVMSFIPLRWLLLLRPHFIVYCLLFGCVFWAGHIEGARSHYFCYSCCYSLLKW